jgi:serine/threonine-protein kinase
MTGSVPFAADTAMGSLMARLGRSMEPPAETGPLAPVLAAAGTVDTEERLDAATFARRLEEVAGRLPYPAPLSLTSPISGGEPERDDISPTVMPGRPRLYDDAEFAESASAPIDLRAPAPEVTDRRRSAPEADSFVAYEADTDPPRRRRRAIIAIAAAVLLIVAAAAVWGVTSGGFLEPEEQVPAVIGLAQPQAATAVSGDHLHLVVTGSEYNAKPAGQVIAQTPAGGRLRRGSDVRVVVSKGPAPVPVPALTNDTVSEAEQVLHTLGIKWTITHATSMTVLANEIISTDPASGTIVPGQTMNLVVSSGKPTVPVPPITLNTESVADAEAALHTAGLTFTATPAYSNTVPKNDVISVSPPSGTQAQVGSEVTLTFSQGPHYVIVPPTKDDSVGNATEILDAAGFNVTGVQGNPVNTVKGTSPPAGQQVLYGSSIQILTH